MLFSRIQLLFSVTLAGAPMTVTMTGGLMTVTLAEDPMTVTLTGVLMRGTSNSMCKVSVHEKLAACWSSIRGSL